MSEDQTAELGQNAETWGGDGDYFLDPCWLVLSWSRNEHGRHVNIGKEVYRYYQATGTISGRVHLGRDGPGATIVEQLREKHPVALYLDEYV